jgi:hypothetical protein
LTNTVYPFDRNKQHEEIIGKVRVSYYFYSNGTVMVFTESSNSPFRLEDEVDRSRLLVFFGQIRDRLVTILADRHERMVKVGEGLQYAGIKVQVKHFDHLFRIYIKSQSKFRVTMRFLMKGFALNWLISDWQYIVMKVVE